MRFPKRICHVLISGSCESDLLWKKEVSFAGVLKLRISRGDHPGLSRWALNPMTSVPLRGKGEVEGQATWRLRWRLEFPSHKVRNARSHQKLEEARRILPQSLWKEHGSASTLISNIQFPEPWENKFVWSHQMWWFVLGSPRKWIQRKC